MTISDALGWIGTCLIVLAYVLLSFDVIEEDDVRYISLNLVGAAGVGANVFAQGTWPALALQILWGGVAIVSLIKNLQKRNDAR